MAQITIPNNQIWAKSSDGNIIEINGGSFAQTLTSTSLNDEGYIVYEFDADVTEVGRNGFSDKTTITEIILPESITKIESSAFNNCTALQSINLPDGITTIDSQAFYNCTSLETIDLPDSLSLIASTTFYNCTSLKNIVIPNGVDELRAATFSHCTSLETVELSESLATINGAAFMSCSSLTEITSHAVTAPTLANSNIFSGVSSGGTLYYPEGSDYSSWLSTDPYYLGYYGWNGVEIEGTTPPDTGGTENPDTGGTENPDTGTTETKTASIGLSVFSLTFPATGSSQTVQVNYTNSVTINQPTCTQSWVTISQVMTGSTTDSNGDTVIQVQYRITMAETTSTSRNTNITFSCVGEDGVTVVEDKFMVYQDAPVIEVSSITPSTTNFSINADGTFVNNNYIDVEYKNFGSIEQINTPGITGSWLKLTNETTLSVTEDGYVIRYYFAAYTNTNTANRSCSIVFSGTGDDEVQRAVTIYATQKEGEAVVAPDYEVHTNYIGYFQSIDGIDYTVKVITDVSSDDYGVVELAGESPFIVNYQTSDILFEPVKKSTATFMIVHNTYLENVLTPYAQGTIVQLESEGKKKWCGFLTPKVYDQNWVNEIEEIELEASDCLSVLQYLDYEPLNERGFVTFKQILDDIVAKTKLINGYYWPQSKIVNGSYLLPDNVGVFEQNFFSNDTDEPWTLYDVLIEICKYLGVTCVQSFNDLYFLDYGDYINQGYGNSQYDYYTPSGVTRGYFHMGKYNPVITADIFRGNDGTISFQPIYNKVVVKDNMYNVEDVFPNIFDDKYLTNINGDFFAAVEVDPLSEYAEYPNGSSWGSQKYKKEEVADTAYRYFMRIYEHKYWQTVYNGNMTLWGGDAVQNLRNILQGRLVDLGTVRETYYSYGQKILPNTVDYNRYICIPTKHTDTNQNTGKVVYRLKDGFKLPCMVNKDSFLVFQNSVKWERYNGRPYINPDWTSAPNKIHLPANSSSYDRIAWPMYRLTIGDKAWSGFRKRWVELDDYHNYFEPIMEWQQDNMDYWNTEIECLNQVSWEENIKEAGYVIPLADVDLTQDIHFEILCPAPSNYGRKDGNYFMMKYNAYCWISDLSVKIVERGQDVDKLDNDIVYENVIDADSMCEYDEIDFRLTTYNENTKPSYSNVVYTSGDTKEFLLTIKDRGITSAEQNAEENYIERIVNQYSTPTQQLSISVTNGHNHNSNYNSIISPFTYGNSTYFPMGTEIDYAASRERITLIEMK